MDPADSTTDERNGDSDGLLAPDGLLDDSLTVVVGVVAGLVVGVLTFVFGFTTESVWVFAVAPLAWIGSTAVVARQRTVFGAVRLGAYATAALIVCVPFVLLGPAAEGGTLLGRILAFLFAEIPFVIVAVPIAGTGRWIGGMAPVDTGSGDGGR